MPIARHADPSRAPRECDLDLQMTNRVLLNNVDHGDLAVTPRYGAEFGDATNSVRLFPTEYEAAQREYPILFRRDDASGRMFAVALLGLDGDENLFLDGDIWRARYVPAVQARGPFSIGVTRRSDGAPGEPMIHVDLDDARVGAEGGHPLFKEQGGNTPYLDRVGDVLRSIATGLEVEAAMFAAFDEFALVQPRGVKVEVDEARRYDLSGFLTIDADRLAALDGAALEKLHRSGFLALAFAVAASLANFTHLIALKTDARRPA